MERAWKKNIGSAKAMIRSKHNSTGDYKTVIASDIPNCYTVVRRVNEMTAQFWLDWYNAFIADYYAKGLNRKYENVKVGDKYNFGSPPEKVNWYIMIRNYRRDEEKRVCEYRQLESIVPSPPTE